MGIKALVFDAYGTLFNVQSIVSDCEELFQGHGQPLSQLWRNKQLEYTWLLSLMGHYEDFWQVTEKALIFACKALGLSCGPLERARLMDRYLHLEAYSDVSPALRALSQYPLAILSNGSPTMLKAVVENAGLAPVLTHLISVDEMRVYKPSPVAYRIASQKLASKPRAIAFVSANSWDAIGAKAFGFWTCWLNRSNTRLDELGFAPDLTVGSLKELADKLNEREATE